MLAQITRRLIHPHSPMRTWWLIWVGLFQKGPGPLKISCGRFSKLPGAEGSPNPGAVECLQP